MPKCYVCGYDDSGTCSGADSFSEHLQRVHNSVCNCGGSIYETFVAAGTPQRQWIHSATGSTYCDLRSRTSRAAPRPEDIGGAGI